MFTFRVQSIIRTTLLWRSVSERLAAKWVGRLAVLVGVGGILGIGEKYLAVPFDAAPGRTARMNGIINLARIASMTLEPIDGQFSLRAC
jgi:hypothetical protein